MLFRSFNINRRKVINGRELFRLDPEGPCDHRVKVLRIDDGKTLEPMAVLMHAVGRLVLHPLVPLLLPLPFMGYAIFGGFLQAFIFITLSQVYLAGAVATEEH